MECAQGSRSYPLDHIDVVMAGVASMSDYALHMRLHLHVHYCCGFMLGRSCDDLVWSFDTRLCIIVVDLCSVDRVMTLCGVLILGCALSLWIYARSIL